MNFLDQMKLEAAIRKEARTLAEEGLVAPTAMDYLYTETAMLRGAALVLMAVTQEIAETKTTRQADGEAQEAN